MYGPKQAAATCFKTISSVFKIGVLWHVSDPCVFVRKDDNKSLIYVTLYVDDLLIGGVLNKPIKEIAYELSSHFMLKTLKKCGSFSALKLDTK